MTQAGPPSWAVRLLLTLVPRRHRDVLSGDVLDQYRGRILPAQGQARANRWFLGQVGQWLWTESRVTVLVVVLAFLFGDGLTLELPGREAALRSWLRATVPLLLLAAAGVRTGWRSGAGAALITGFTASCFGTAAILAVTTVALAIAQPQLMKIGMSWESLRDLALVLRSATLTGTTVAAAGGIAGALAFRARTTDGTAAAGR